ncbi:MAG: VWA domain-containing protein, partial [Actinobacteria bacterium]|nr:VWA domain-containing protein [Actinomycetota bacterium]
MRAHGTWTSGRIRRNVLAGAASALAMVGLPLLAAAPAGAVPGVDGNPDLAAGCGLDVTLVLDDSASIDGTEATQAREAAQLFADALDGTPSQLKTVVFDTRARGVAADGSLTSNLSNIVFRDPSAYTAPTSGAGQGGTNWDDGLEVARRSNGGPGDLVVFITDGDPTYRNSTSPDGHANDGSHSISGDGSTIGVAANLDNAVTEATAMRNAGTHLFGIGVGLAQNGASEQRLNDVTGDEELTLNASGSVPPFGQGDYTITPNFAQLKTVVADFSRQLCGHTVNVTKFLQKADGTTVQATASTPWEFTLTLDPAPGQWNNPPGVVGPTASLTTDANGGVSFVLDQATPPDDHLGDLVETPQDGWDYNGATCSVNDFSGSDPMELFDSVGPNEPGSVGDPSELLDLPVSKGKALNCSVYNRERRPATISVAKSTVPAGQPGSFDFTLSQGQATVDTLTGLSHGDTQAFDPVPEGSYSVTEAPAPGYLNTSATCDDLGTPGVEAVPADELSVTEGQNWRCSFVNDAQSGTIRVVKDAVGADGTFSFTSNVPDLGDFSLTTTGGTASTQAITVPVGTYSVAETVPGGWDLTGASCTGGDDPSSITVSPAETVVCTFENTAPDPTIVVAKSAGAASVAEPGGPVTYTVSVTNTSVEPVTVDSVVDSIDGGPDLDLTSVGGPITATTCVALVGTQIVAGGSAGCTFTATVSGNGGGTVADEVTVVALDSDENEATDSDGASVDVTDVAPTVALTKTPSVSAISEPGGAVTYTLQVTNTGVEPLLVDALRDSIEGGPSFSVASVAGLVTATTCDAVVGSTIAPDGSASCQYTVVHVVDASDVPDGFVDDVARVDASDDDGETFATAAAKVAVLDVAPTITVDKTADPTSVPETAPGATAPVTYTVAITNTSPEAVTIDSIVDAVDGGSPAAVAGTCDDLVGSSLAAGATTSCTFTLAVAGEAGTSTSDVVTVGASDDEDNDTTSSDDATVAFTDVASSIEVTKVATTPTVPEPGGPASFLVTIQNTSATDDVTIGSVVDSVDGGTPFAVAGTCPDLVGDLLVPGQSTQCTFTLDVAGPAGASVADTVTVTGTDDDGGSVSDSADAAVRITDVPSSLAVTKVANVDSLPEPGGPVTYTVSVTNTSAVDSVSITSVTDSVDGGTPFAAGGDCPTLVGVLLAPGDDASCTFTLDVAGQPGDSVADTVTVAGIDDDQQPVSDSADESVAITGVASSLAVTKVASVDSLPEPGGPVTYLVAVQNTSAADAVTIDSVTDSVDGGAPFAAGGDCPDLVGDVLDPGDMASCSFTLDVTGDPGDVVADTVTVAGTDDDGAPVSDSADESVAITGVASSLAVTKDADVASVPEPGGPVTYTVTVTNTSAVDAVTIDSVTDSVDGGAPFAAGGDCPDLVGDVLDPGDSTACSFTMLVLGQAGDTVGDTVTVAGTDDDGDAVSAQGSESVDVTDVRSSIEVTKVANVDSVPEPGGPVTYTVTVANTSAVDAVTIDSVTDSVDGGAPFAAGGDCPDLVGDLLLAGGSASCSFTLDVAGAPGDSVADTVTVAGTDDDGAAVSAQGSETVGITDVASSLSVTKVADADSVPEPGGPVSFDLTVTNTSDVDAVTIDSVTDSVDGGAPFAAGGDCPDLVGDVLDPGDSASCSFVVPVLGEAGDVVADTVTVAGTDDDGDAVSATGDETVGVTDVASSLSVTKVADVDSVPEPGGPVSFDVTVTNTSDVDAVTIDSITDSVDGGAPFAAGGDCPDLVGDELAPGGSASCSFTLDVTGDPGDVVADTVAVTGTDD